MKKQQRSQPAIVIEWNSDTGAAQNGIDGISESVLLQLARALGRMAARRDLAAARENRARSATTSDPTTDIVSTKALT
jgi:hypothetical protein